MTRQVLKQNLKALLRTAKRVLVRPGFDHRKGLVVVMLDKSDNDEHGKHRFI